MLEQHADRVAELALVPGSGGVFEVQVDGRTVFSKHEAGRHAEAGEVARLVAQALGHG